MRAAYPEPVWALFQDLPGLGVLPPGPGVVRARAGTRTGGCEVEVSLRQAAGAVTEARFRAWGCPWTLALAAAAVSRLPGCPVAEVAALGLAEQAAQLGLPADRAAVRLCVEDAIRAAGTAALEGEGR